MEPSYVQNPYPFLARLREQDPVHYSRATGTYFLTRYKDIWSLLRDSRALAMSADQIRMSTGQQAQEGPFQRAMRRWIVLLNPPDHTRVRNLLNKSFTPKVISRLHDRVEDIANELLDPILESGSADLIREFANPLPMLVIADQLGVPRTDRPRFKAWSDTIAMAMDPIQGRAFTSEGDRATDEMFAYLADFVKARREQPQDDLLTKMVAAEEDGDRLSMDELLSACMLLLFAGNETTTGLMGNSVASLLDNRDQEEKLRALPEVPPIAVEEFLRYETPSHTMGRVLSAPMELGGKPLPKGARIICVMGAANHDPEVFEDPDLLDLERDPNPHIAFGTGHHFCLGSHLARLETRVMLNVLLRRVKRFDLSVRRVPYRATVALRGPKALPMTLQAA